MKEASTINAAVNGKLWVRSDAIGHGAMPSLMTADEIMNGQSGIEEAGFQGIIPMIKEYMAGSSQFDERTRIDLDNYLDLVANRASGKVATTATWIRRVVDGHPAYKHDSVVAENVVYDIIEECVKKSS